jgi:hypothetical protein
MWLWNLLMEDMESRIPLQAMNQFLVEAAAVAVQMQKQMRSQ